MEAQTPRQPRPSDPLVCMAVDLNDGLFGGLFDWLACRTDSTQLQQASQNGSGPFSPKSPLGRNSSRTDLKGMASLYENNDTGIESSQQWRCGIQNISCSSVQGHRETMEDYHTVRTEIYGRHDLSAVAVFDGHCGSRASKFCHDVMVDSIIRSPEFLGNLERGMASAIKQTSNAYNKQAQSHGWPDGTTAVVAFLSGSTLCVANIGDSRAVLARRDQATQTVRNIDMSVDHKPSNETELARIREVKGFVGKSFGEYQSSKGGSFRLSMAGKAATAKRNLNLPDRVYPGGLSVARTVGDVFIKQQCPGAIIDRPDLVKQRLGPSDEFLILACDGLWDVVSSLEACTLAAAAIDSERDPAEHLSNAALSRGSRDNITVIVVLLSWHESKITAQAILSPSTTPPNRKISPVPPNSLTSPFMPAASGGGGAGGGGASPLSSPMLRKSKSMRRTGSFNNLRAPAPPSQP